MAEFVQAWKSEYGALFGTEDEAARHEAIEAAAAIVAPPVAPPALFNDMKHLRQLIAREIIAELYDTCGWRPVS